MTATTESEYLIISNKEKATELLSITEPTEANIIDAFIALHIILEVSLNTLFRHISMLSIKKDIDRLEIIKNIDAISFIDKTVLFIYDSKFNFTSIEDATHYHSTIGVLKDFSSIRNQLLHGHSISTISDEEGTRQSRLKKSLNDEALSGQIKKLLFVFEGLRFYVDCLESSLTTSGKAAFKKAYLDDTFIPDRYKR